MPCTTCIQFPKTPSCNTCELYYTEHYKAFHCISDEHIRSGWGIGGSEQYKHDAKICIALSLVPFFLSKEN